MKRAAAVVGVTVGLVLGVAGPASACGGLIGPNGAVNLVRTSTFAGYHDGVEHYVTSFAFAGGGGKFGSLTPLPGVPTKVERGGDWTLQRLVRETQPAFEGRALLAPTAADSAKGAEVILEVKVDALDITVLKGGGADVGAWATKHGFRLPPDAPEVLDFYAQRSPIFLAAAFDADEARKRGQEIGDGTPVHITIPTQNPWVPLRILGLGKQANDRVDADVYLLTDARPRLLSTEKIGSGEDSSRTLSVTFDQDASPLLLKDIRDDKSGSWIPQSGWLTKLRVGGSAETLTGDLAIDPTGRQKPSMVAAGYSVPAATTPAAALPPVKQPYREPPWPALAVGLLVLVVLGGWAVSAVRRPV
jgi:hypothetical protein